MNHPPLIKLHRTAGTLAVWVFAISAIGFSLIVPVLICGTPARASIVDVSGIEVPPVNGPVGDEGDGGGYDADGSSDSDDLEDSTPANTPTVQQPQTSQAATPVDQEAQKKQLFEREKQELLDTFSIPQGLSKYAIENVPEEDDTDAVRLDDETSMGAGRMPSGLGQANGLSSEEWSAAGECQRQLDLLHAKWPLSAEEIAQEEKLEAQRNAFWKKAVSMPGLTADERERIRLKFLIASLQPGAPPPPAVTSDTLKKWEKAPVPPIKEPTSSAPTPQLVNPVTALVVKESLLNRPVAGIDYIGQELADSALGDENPFGDILGLAKIAVSYKTEGQASARAAAADFLVGLLRYPQASFAVDGGRIYAKTTFQAMNTFMTDAMKATGGEFDKEKFWTELKSESSKGTQGLMEWIGNGAD